MKKINELVNQILLEKSCSFSADDYFDMDLFYDGTLDKNELSLLIKLSSEQNKIEPLLCQVVSKFINANSVDLNNFDALLNYKGRCRRTLLWNLSEVPLSFYQTQILFNRFRKSFPEIVCNLITTMYVNDCFSEYDLEYYLNRSNAFELKSIMDISALIASVPINHKTKLLSAYL